MAGVLERFGTDRRVVAWDLFNEPDQLDAVTLAAGSRAEKAAAATALVDIVFGWAHDVDPEQPITVGVWEYGPDHRPIANPLNDLILERSDIITFHCYEPRAELTAVIDALSIHERPLVCTEWLARTAGSTVDLLEVFAARGTGAINWGLVDGRTQTRFPWRSWIEPVTDDEPWFHELLHADGTPYDPDEVATIRRLTSDAD
ncbi:MAG: cellulase family glycosylhydrolase [Ilumatobacteraceae bacterium]